MNKSNLTSATEGNPSHSKRRYAIVGTGGRSWMFIQALTETYRDECDLVAFCDLNQTRMNYYNRTIVETFGVPPVPTYLAKDFDRMFCDAQPDVVIVSTIDRTHHLYIIRALELGRDVITEKPLTIDVEKCGAILDAVERTGRKLTVTFNYRYAPIRARV
jgi:predicted dehydrogenase